MMWNVLFIHYLKHVSFFFFPEIFCQFEQVNFVVVELGLGGEVAHGGSGMYCCGFWHATAPRFTVYFSRTLRNQIFDAETLASRR